ncbi:17603_t:CDS:1, partial [Funneliformis geosporum]
HLKTLKETHLNSSSSILHINGMFTNPEVIAEGIIEFFKSYIYGNKEYTHPSQQGDSMPLP